jgi:hypothetical protein
VSEYRVVQEYVVEADSAEQAQRIVGTSPHVQLVELRSRLAGLPRQRMGTALQYEQEFRILDWAWDRLMDQMVPATISERPKAPRVPTLMEMGVDTAIISVLFDTAISAYREHVELADPRTGI